MTTTTTKPEAPAQEWDRLWAHYIAKLAAVDAAVAVQNERPNKCLNASERALFRAKAAIRAFNVANGYPTEHCL